MDKCKGYMTCPVRSLGGTHRTPLQSLAVCSAQSQVCGISMRMDCSSQQALLAISLADARCDCSKALKCHIQV